MIRYWILAILPTVVLVGCQKPSPELASSAGGGPEVQEVLLAESERSESSAAVNQAIRAEADVLGETAAKGMAETRLGIMLSYNGEKLSDEPSRYALDFIVSVPEKAAIQVRVRDDEPPYDRVIALTSTAGEPLQAAYQDIQILLSIVDKANARSDSLRTTLAELLHTASSGQGSSSQVIPTVSIYSVP